LFYKFSRIFDKYARQQRLCYKNVLGRTLKEKPNDYGSSGKTRNSRGEISQNGSDFII
jgi:hypothetical protein